MHDLWESAKLFVSGPIWLATGVLSALLAILGLLESEHFWMLLFFAALITVGAAFYVWHLDRLAIKKRLETLPESIDALMRNGLELRDKLAELPPNAIETRERSVSYKLGPSRAREGLAYEFDERTRKLLAELRPSLLWDYTEAANAFVKREQEGREPDENGTQTLTLVQFVKMLHSRPAVQVAASLEGLVAARNRLGG